MKKALTNFRHFFKNQKEESDVFIARQRMARRRYAVRKTTTGILVVTM